MTITEKPILFSGPMVQAILAGTKTQTRRVVKPQLTPGADGIYDYVVNGRWLGALNPRHGDWNFADKCPYGVVGSRLWVRETWSKETIDGVERVAYRADIPNGYNFLGWKPSIFMPRWASRLNLENMAIRVERLQDISDADAQAEGLVNAAAFQLLWDMINGKRAPWASNPWVWVITFKPLAPEV